MAERGRLDEQFIEGMCCDGGCFHGPFSVDTTLAAVRSRREMISAADDRTVVENLENYDLDSFSRYR